MPLRFSSWFQRPSGGGNGRVYTLTYRATDAAGNVGFGSADVTVPKNRSGK